MNSPENTPSDLVYMAVKNTGGKIEAITLDPIPVPASLPNVTTMRRLTVTVLLPGQATPNRLVYDMSNPMEARVAFDDLTELAEEQSGKRFRKSDGGLKDKG